MNHFADKKPGIRLALLVTLALCIVAWTAGFPAGKAAAAGDGTIFTVENETLYAGSDASQLNFTLTVHNETGTSVVDMNDYGVRLSGGGASYPASLTTQYGARVKAGASQKYNYSAMVPGQADVTALQVTLFQWDMKASGYMRDIASFPFTESAVKAGSGQAPQTLVSLRQVDAALPQGASAAFQLGNSYSVNQAGQWMLDAELWATNIGDASFKLPSTLAFRFLDADKITYAAVAVDGGDKTLLPNKPVKITVQAPVAGPYSKDEGLSLQLVKSTQTDPLILGDLNLKGSLRSAPVLSVQNYEGIWQNKSITLITSSVAYTEQDDGVHVRVKETIANTGYTTLAAPALAGSFQFGADGYVAASAGSGTHPAFLPPRASANYYFSAVLPNGVFPADVQLVTYETKAGNAAPGGGAGAAASAVLLPVAVTDLKGANAANEADMQAMDYKFGTAFALDANQAIDGNLKVELDDLRLADTDASGYRTALAKFKITNTGTKKLAVPTLSTELAGEAGMTYDGINAQTTPQQVSPKTSVVATYTYLLPPDEEGTALTLKINDDKAAAPDKVALGVYKAAVQPETEDGVINVYPFKLDITGHDFYQYTIDKGTGTYTFLFGLSGQITQTDPAIVGSAFSKLEFDLINANGKTLGTSTFPFIGTGKMDSNYQRMFFAVKSDENLSNLHVDIYETVTTADGTVKRLIRTIPV